VRPRIPRDVAFTLVAAVAIAAANTRVKGRDACLYRQKPIQQNTGHLYHRQKTLLREKGKYFVSKWGRSCPNTEGAKEGNRDWVVITTTAREITKKQLNQQIKQNSHFQEGKTTAIEGQLDVATQIRRVRRTQVLNVF